MELKQRDSEILDTLDICDIEYDVAGVGAEEAPATEANHAAYFFVAYRRPETRN